MIYRRTILIIISMIVAACIYVPSPQHGVMSGRAIIRDSDIEALEPGKTTREEVLLMFGDPAERRGRFDDEFFCYRWEQVKGFIDFYDGPDYSSAHAKDIYVGQVHYFCAQFSSDNVLIRKAHVEASTQKIKTKRNEVLDSWRRDEG